MANAGHLVRRTSQREMLAPQKSLERYEMRDMRRLMSENGAPSYGTANQDDKVSRLTFDVLTALKHCSPGLNIVNITQ